MSLRKETDQCGRAGINSWASFSFFFFPSLFILFLTPLFHQTSNCIVILFIHPICSALPTVSLPSLSEHTNTPTFRFSNAAWDFIIRGITALMMLKRGHESIRQYTKRLHYSILHGNPQCIALLPELKSTGCS